MQRHRLTDEQWDRIKDLVPGKEGDPGRRGQDNRGFVEAVLWLARTGAPWRDLRSDLAWNSVWRRFSRWAKRGVWDRILHAVAAWCTDQGCGRTDPLPRQGQARRT